MNRIVLGLAFGCVLGVANARDLGQWEATDSAIREWYQALMQPDNPNVSCCGEVRRLLGRRDSRQGRQDLRDGHGRPAGRTAPPAAYRRRNRGRNPEPQAQMGQIESDRARRLVHEPRRLRLLLRAARRRVAARARSGLESLIRSDGIGAGLCLFCFDAFFRANRALYLASSVAFFASGLHQARKPAIDHPLGVERHRFRIRHRFQPGISHHLGVDLVALRARFVGDP